MDVCLRWTVYINHRPVFGLQADRLDWAFRMLGIPADGETTASMTRADLLDGLQNRGECRESKLFTAIVYINDINYVLCNDSGKSNQ